MPRATKLVSQDFEPEFSGSRPELFHRICTAQTEYKTRNAELNPGLKITSSPRPSDVTLLLFASFKIHSGVILWGF